ncbi:F-type H+-transporting ATPase subunit delta [Bifidobacterium bohemicum]|uniref:ATP synthase subunit delta n=1 Tax=Bifidobacterium bohemicum DSM 22767 TaxID=1437606 RepID=A0A086ZH23_9BIFI|nr:ATP synthase delta chain protein [Bifidobacterium bohemicum DSM 22767]SCC10050.1 F-type H+-transporting ATPase subunit delta [Bifidobacterium bohemicum]
MSADHTSRDALAPRLKAQGKDTWRIGEDLFIITDLLDHNRAVESALTDLSRPTSDKITLVKEMLGSSAHPFTIEILSDLVGRKWSHVCDIANAVEDFGVDAMMYYADMAGDTYEVSTELAQLHSALVMLPVLRSKLTDETASSQARIDLLHEVLHNSRLNPVTMRLAEHLTWNPRHRRYLSALQWLIAKFSHHMGQSMVTVITAVALGSNQIDRLTKFYSAKLGRPAYINSLVDPEVIGGMRVQVGDEVTDNTVVAQLSELNRRLESAM